MPATIRLVLLVAGLGNTNAKLRSQVAFEARRMSPLSDVRYIDNGVIRLGVDLLRGGSISFLADSKNLINIINTHDMGREVQLSFYADPSFYNPPTAQYPGGACDKLFGGQEWPWNPIGAGDIDGNRGEIVSFQQTATLIHLVTRPLQWACHNVSCECTFEQTVELFGTGARVNATLHNARTDISSSAPHDQELPAVYVNGPYYRLISYSGSSPFTSGPTTEYSTSPHVPWHPGKFAATERWAALVNEGNWGLGVINPDQETFLGGFAGNPGSGGSDDDPTGYLAPVAQLSLNPQETYAFTFFLVLGDLETIRAYAYEHRDLQI